MGRRKGARDRWSINLWVTPEERSTIEYHAREAGLPTALFLRDVGLGFGDAVAWLRGHPDGMVAVMLDEDGDYNVIVHEADGDHTDDD